MSDETAPVGFSVRTLRNSQYDLLRDSYGQFWVRGRNMPNPRSSQLAPETWYIIARPTPWPPQPGVPLVFMAPSVLERGDPRRVPGGGKRSSPVVQVEPRPGSRWPTSPPTLPLCPRCGDRPTWWQWIAIQIGGEALCKLLPPSVTLPTRLTMYLFPFANCAGCGHLWVTVDAPAYVPALGEGGPDAS
jgi:hypothetical protein